MEEIRRAKATAGRSGTSSQGLSHLLPGGLAFFFSLVFTTFLVIVVITIDKGPCIFFLWGGGGVGGFTSRVGGSFCWRIQKLFF